MSKKRVLFVCVHNAARSQMAEVLLNHMAGDLFEAESAGLTPGSLNPLAVKAMQKIGLDISRQTPKSVFDLFKAGRIFHFVIAVCDAEAAEKCPIFPSAKETLSWSFKDPSSFLGSEEEKLAQTEQVRDEIKKKLEAWIDLQKKGQPAPREWIFEKK